ncbi:hypothetical protein NC651_025959 [Populus alba x Populus x berolinensis]|nr:hypothetical protein NC651_025959 [Populus alba x Populus x berolinensis]
MASPLPPLPPDLFVRTWAGCLWRVLKGGSIVASTAGLILLFMMILFQSLSTAGMGKLISSRRCKFFLILGLGHLLIHVKSGANSMLDQREILSKPQDAV